MDTSKQYIEMCDCPEIQEKKVAIRIKDNFVQVEIGKRVYYVWLPRQDQIQEMINYCSTNFICGLYDWFVEPGGREDEFDSYEKLWLAYYMWEYHKKIWSSKETKWMKKK